MSERYYSISDEVFEKFPDYKRRVVVAHGVKNGPSPPELLDALRAAEAQLRRAVKPEDLGDHPRIASWRYAFRQLGMNPNAFRPSMDAMARRVLKNQELPSISALVDTCNVISLKYLVPVGGHATDVVTGNIALRPAAGDENFVPFGQLAEEPPEKGEFILSEGNKVLARRWIWRQANHTLVLPETTALVVNIDFLPPVTDGEADAITGEMREMIEKFCGGTLRTDILSRGHQRISVDA